MANAKRKALARESHMQKALTDYVEHVKLLPNVSHVAVLESIQPDVYTYLDRRDDALCRQVFEVENRIWQQFPEHRLDFHIVFLEKMNLNDALDSSASLIYSRSQDG